MTCAKQTWLGAYVLDALEPGETEDVSTHIAGCSICQDEVVRLAWIPGLLRTIALEDIERLDDYSIPDGRPHSPALDQPQTASRGKRTTRRWRRPVAVLAGLAAAATIGCGRDRARGVPPYQSSAGGDPDHRPPQPRPSRCHP